VAKGERSNIVAVIEFMRRSRGEHSALGHAVEYFLSFFAYPDPGLHLEGRAFREFFRARILSLTLWGAIVAFDAVWFWRLRRRNGKTYRYSARLLVYVCGAVAFALFWATRQYGDPFAFNAWFTFAIVASFLVPPAAELAGLLESAPRRLRVALVCAAATGVCLLWRRDYVPTFEELPVLAKVRGRVAQLSPASTVLLRFEPGDWPTAGCVALELKRRGVRFEVPGEWGIMFLSQTPETVGPATEIWEIAGNDAFTIKRPAVN
jgi:hypothetical protein